VTIMQHEAVSYRPIRNFNETNSVINMLTIKQLF